MHSRRQLAVGRARAGLLTLVLAGCGAPAATQPGATAQSATPPATAMPSPAPALVGTWVGVHNCQRIVEVLTAAGMPSQILPNILDGEILPASPDPSHMPDPANPCTGAVEVKHSHFFTADGAFGSLDQNGQQVDDGRWSLVDASTFAIDAAHVHFVIDGDTLRMEPLDVGPCPTGSSDWCPEAWKLMVAMPGMALTRAP
jgi:hypothetical protein